MTIARFSAIFSIVSKTENTFPAAHRNKNRKKEPSFAFACAKNGKTM